MCVLRCCCKWVSWVNWKKNEILVGSFTSVLRGSTLNVVHRCSTWVRPKCVCVLRCYWRWLSWINKNKTKRNLSSVVVRYGYQFSAFLTRSVWSNTQMDSQMLRKIRRIGESFRTKIAFAPQIRTRIRIFLMKSLHFCDFGAKLMWQNDFLRHFILFFYKKWQKKYFRTEINLKNPII